MYVHIYVRMQLLVRFVLVCSQRYLKGCGRSVRYLITLTTCNYMYGVTYLHHLRIVINVTNEPRMITHARGFYVFATSGAGVWHD